MRCRHCYAEIEEASGVWWLKNTCRSACYGAQGTFDRHEPDLRDVSAVERWLIA